ncbi:MAG: ankyrin repeat domain-containing protein [Akkermansia sp.]|nr:ankyrin repeat domain-containing protein [Akkermansia sp.]
MSLDIQQLFHKAVSNNDVETARRMIEAGADVNYFSTEEFPPIVEAVSHQTTDMVKLLLENGANPDLASTYGVSALVVSAETENLEMMQMLLHAGADPNYSPDCDYSPLHAACCWDDEKVAKLLLEAGANPHAVEALAGDSVLMAAAESSSTECVKLLLTCNVDVNHVNYDGETALTYAVYQQNQEIVSMLLTAGANPNIAESLSGTPLSVAIENQDYAITTLLIKADARCRYDETYYSPWVLENFDGPALYRNLMTNGVTVRTDDDALFLYVRHSCAYLLRKALEAGANPNATSIYGTSLLTRAIEHPHHSQGFAVRLIQHGATFDSELLIFAVRNNMRELVTAILKAGTDINAKDERGNTALHCAARMGKVYFITELIENGAYSEVKNNANYTPLLLAIRYRRFEAATILLNYGADIMSAGGKHNEDATAMSKRYHCKIVGKKLLNNPWIKEKNES